MEGGMWSASHPDHFVGY